LCGGHREIASAEEVLMIQEQIRQIYKFLPELDPRQQQIVIRRLGLFGTSECTWNELSLIFNVSRERVRQIFKGATRKLAIKYFRKTRDPSPITKSVFEHPDLLECEIIHYSFQG
jgi:DNA-directed RNA polymerase sigma subunit (sigma70/sigma32)